MTIVSLAVLLSLLAFTPQAPASTAPAPLLVRRYEDGAQLSYRMRGENDGVTYSVRLQSVVRKGADGRMGEEYSFSESVLNGQPRALAASAESFRASATLEPGGAPFTLPDLSQAPGLVGPVLDLLTFYADLFVAMHGGTLRHEGDRFYFVPTPAVPSWADGSRVLIGEDAIDFDVSVTAVDRPAGIATLLVKHVPPKEGRIRIPAEWMRAPVGSLPNNWVQVRRTGDAYVAAVGQETFDVVIRVRLSDGVIVSAAMDNPVTARERECKDEALTQCGEPRPHQVLRRIEMTLEP